MKNKSLISLVIKLAKSQEEKKGICTICFLYIRPNRKYGRELNLAEEKNSRLLLLWSEVDYIGACQRQAAGHATDKAQAACQKEPTNLSR